MVKVTGKQLLFVEHYLQCWDGTAAALAAGYSGDPTTRKGRVNLSAGASRLMSKPHIRKEIRNRLAEAGMSADECIARISMHAKSKNPRVALKALEIIAKRWSLLTDKVELSGSLDVRNMSDEELEKLAGRG